MDEPFSLFLLTVAIPLSYLGWRVGLFSTPALRVATTALLLGLVILNWPRGTTYALLERYNLMVAGATVAILALRHLGASWLRPVRRYRIVLGLTAAAAVAGHTNFFAFHGGTTWVHYHDVAHYYLGSKYSSELGYGNLYVGILRAELEEFRSFLTPEARDLTGSLSLVPVETLIERSDPVKNRFSPERWSDFRRDVRALRVEMGAAWADVVRDHGYNPTPVWTVVGGFLANRIPAGDPAALHALTLIDPLLLALSFAAVVWVFGVETAFLVTIYFCIAFGAMFSWKGGAFLRELSLAGIVLATCALGRGRGALGGALLGLSAALRVYPVLLAVGPTVHAMTRVRFDGWRPALRTLSFPLGFGAALVLLVLLSFARPGGPGEWRGFTANISAHSQSLSANRIGVTNGLAFLAGGDVGTTEGLARAIHRGRTLQRIQLATLFVLALGFVCLRAPRVDEVSALAMGSLLVFTGLNLSAYYYTFLVVLVIAFRDRPDRLALVFAVELGAYLVRLFEEHGVMLYVYKSLLLVYLFVALWLDDFRTETVRVARVIRHKIDSARERQVA